MGYMPILFFFLATVLFAIFIYSIAPSLDTCIVWVSAREQFDRQWGIPYQLRIPRWIRVVYCMSMKQSSK